MGGCSYYDHRDDITQVIFYEQKHTDIAACDMITTLIYLS